MICIKEEKKDTANNSVVLLVNYPGHGSGV